MVGEAPSKMSVVQGEDIESDEDELGYETPEDDNVAATSGDSSKETIATSKSERTVVSGEETETDEEEEGKEEKRRGSSETQEVHADTKGLGTVVSGEESETDDEEGDGKNESSKRSKAASNVRPPSGSAKEQDSSSSKDSKSSPATAGRTYMYNSDPHNRLREKVISFYSQVHQRLGGMYSTTARNLRGVNDGLGRLQDTTAKVHVSVERNQSEVVLLNERLKGINFTARTLTPNLRLPRAQPASA